MGTVFIDGSTVRDFVNDEEAFLKAVDPIFEFLDANRDGVLSRCELRPAFESMSLIESHFGLPEKKTPEELNAIYDGVFKRFDTDSNDSVDIPEFRSQLKEIMLAVADGLGASPITLLVEEGSLFKVAADREAAAGH